MDYEQAKAYLLEPMMSADVEENAQAECVYIRLIQSLSECSDVDYYFSQRALLRQGSLFFGERSNVFYDYY